MTRLLLRKVLRTVTVLYTKALASRADHRFAGFVSKLEKLFNELIWRQSSFGEGITLLKNEVIQLTWQSQMGFVYNVSDFRLLRRFSYLGEGWGLTTNGREIFMSDGTSEIRVLDAGTLAEKRHFTVYDGDTPVDQLNELEFVDGEIFANVWQTDRIARISPQSGKVVGWIDLKGLLSPIYRLESGAVLNGIAYDSNRKRLFVTGKLWPNIFEIRLVPKPLPTYRLKPRPRLGRSRKPLPQ